VPDEPGADGLPDGTADTRPDPPVDTSQGAHGPYGGDGPQGGDATLGPGAAPSALPSALARVLAFAAIIVAGLCGGLIGFAVADLQCTGDCTVPTSLAAVGGAIVAAGGVAVIAVLVLRAMSEWRAQAPLDRR